PFLLGMPLSMTPGSSIIASPELRCRHGLRRDLSSSALPILPAIRFTRGKYFGASRFTHLLRPAKLLAPLYGSDRHARPSRAFTSRLPTDRLPSPLLDMTTTATGLLCWRDSHPLEWQLASLHPIRTLTLRVILLAPAASCPRTKAARLPLNIGFLPLPVDPISKAMTHPLRSTGITPLQHYYEAVRPSPAHRYFRPRGWSRLCLFPWHRRPGSHGPYKSLVELRAAYTPDAAL